MKESKKNYQHFILPFTIMLCAVILGGSYYLVERNKQLSIERQNQAKIEAEEKTTKEEAEKEADQKRALQKCLSQADKDYWAYVELNGTKKDDGTVNALTTVWDRAEKTKNETIDQCNERYRNKSFNSLDYLF